jgi:UDP-N-acetylglucosamine--N-acetylmuramyl-(pentapeptide) pyrophosphoryl-undecaprenol N-acetylglucosamine transferase
LLIRGLKPSIIFTRGGFVSVPVALGGLLNRVPYVTHDSDSTPSLANRIIARWAVKHAVALPKDVYPYPAAKTVTVGIPIDAQYQPVTPEKQRAFRHDLGITAKQVVLVTGGGNGAQQLNNAMVANTRQLLAKHRELTIVHIAGRAHEAAVLKAYSEVLPESAMHRVIVKSFITDLYRYSGAADVIIARGGATNLAEFATQGKACIIVPSEQLTWTVKNMEVMGKRNAVRALTVAQSEQEGRLGAAIAELLDDDTARDELAANLASFAHPHAARELAELILTEAKT